MFAFRRKDLEGLTEAPVRQPFYSFADLAAGAVTAIVAFVSYAATLAPGVTLNNAGELATAAYHFGVPHPPGYPTWTLFGWFWSHLFPFGNIAWRLGVLSAIAGALAAGMVTLLVAKSSRVMLAHFGLLERLRQLRDGERLILVGAVSAGLMLAFSAVLWSQATMVAVSGLEALCLMLVLAGVFRWSLEPQRRWRLYVAGWLWGAGIGVRPIHVLLGLALPIFVWATDRKLGRDLLVIVLAGVVAGVGILALQPDGLLYQGVFPAMVLLGAGAGAAFWLYRLWREAQPVLADWRPVLLLAGVVGLGLAFYLYLPVASSTNPPMNGGYTRTWDGFLQQITRDQFEPFRVGRGALQFWGQLNMFLGDLTVEFGIAYALLGLLVWLFIREMDDASWRWLQFLLLAFFSAGLGFLFFSNPSLEKQAQFAERLFFLPAHCIYALWVGYGLVLGSVFVCGRRAWLQRVTLPVTVLVAALPVISFARQWAEANQRGHDFGTELGYRLFQPGGDYSEMDYGAVLFAGSEPGRCIATYMAFVESQVATDQRLRPGTKFDRRDVTVISQGALVSPQYRAGLRDHYTAARPEPTKREVLASRPWWQNRVLGMWWYGLGRDGAYPAAGLRVPGEAEVQAVWQQDAAQMKGRPQPQDELVEVVNGKVRVRGKSARLAVNGVLSRLIFEQNRDTHTFYVEEGEIVPWMYEFAVPFGIILRLNSEPLPLFDQRVEQRDRRYWDVLTRDLRGNVHYQHDRAAQQVFARLRATLAGLYAYRGLTGPAEYAYRQALVLCPESFEASYRLGQFYAGLNRWDDALAVLTEYQKRDRYNAQIQDAIRRVVQMRGTAGTVGQPGMPTLVSPGR